MTLESKVFVIEGGKREKGQCVLSTVMGRSRGGGTQEELSPHELHIAGYRQNPPGTCRRLRGLDIRPVLLPAARQLQGSNIIKLT